MKAIRILLFIVLGLGALWVLLGLFARKNYHIERTAEIDAPRDIVFEQVRLFGNFKNWSPWHVYDPNMKTEIVGTDGEPGASYNWEGNDKAGKGTLALKSVSPERIDIDIDWGWGVSPASFRLQETAGGKKTGVAWSMDMHVAFPWNAFAMLTDLNAFVGKDFDNGLANLKKVCEQIAHPKYRGYEVVETEIPLKYYLGTREEVSFPDIPSFYAKNLPRAMGFILEQKLTPAGGPSGLFWVYDEKAGKTDMAAVIPVTEPKKIDSLQQFPVGGGRALVIEYFGPYEKTGEAHFALDDYIAEKKLKYVPPVIEEYVTDPASEPDTTKWLTKIIYFVTPAPDSLAVGGK